METEIEGQFNKEEALHNEVEFLASELMKASDQEKAAMEALSTLSTDILDLQFPHLQNELQPDQALNVFIELHRQLSVNDEQTKTLSLNRTVNYYSNLRANTAARMQAIIHGMKNRLQENHSAQSAYMDWMGVVPMYLTAVGESATILQVAPIAISTELSRLQLELLYRDRAREIVQRLVENDELVTIPEAIRSKQIAERINTVIQASLIRKK